ncbi:MAG: HAD-IIIA family hydrolase [Candidatus Hadarchaeales archaeon]
MKAVFLDRDGVINEIVYFPELGILDSPLNPRQFKLLPKVGEAIKKLNRLGLKVVVVSNQPVVAKGKTTMEVFERIRAKMKRELEKKGARIDAEYYCFHHPQAKYARYRVRCKCRKPKPGLLLQASKDLGVTLKGSYMIGDSPSDILAGKAVGCKTFLVGYLKPELLKLIYEKGARPDFIVRDLMEAVKIIEREVKAHGNIS